MIFEHRLRVRYAETDAMGVAHHAAYLVWLEAARVEWIRHIGFPFADFEASGYHHAVREVQVQYRRPARFDQLLALHVALAVAAGPRMTFGYRLYDAAEADAGADPSPLAVARTEMIWVTAAGRATRLPAAHPFTPVLSAIARYPDWATW